MKKFIITILAVFYLGVSSGATMHFHYCMGQLIEWGLASKKSKECSNCGMKARTADDCCKHQNKQVKVDSPQKISESVYQIKAPAGNIIPAEYFSASYLYSPDLIEEHPNSNSPPGFGKVSTIVLHCNFRI